MPGVARLGDKSDESDGFNSSPSLEGSKKVFCGGIGVLFLGAKFGDQKREVEEPVIDEKTGKQKEDSEGKPMVKKVIETIKVFVISGSPTVFVEGVPLARKGDKLSHGIIVEGAEDVSAN